MLNINWKLVLTFWATIFIPLLYLLNIYLITEFGNSFIATTELKILGLIIAISGLIFWIISYINLGFSFGVLPKKQQKVTKGLYKYFNHPMYIGISMVFIGLSIANTSWQGLIFYNLVMLPILILRAKNEEKNLVN